jgi:hypothetical protein
MNVLQNSITTLKEIVSMNYSYNRVSDLYYDRIIDQRGNTTSKRLNPQFRGLRIFDWFYFRKMKNTIEKANCQESLSRIKSELLISREAYINTQLTFTLGPQIKFDLQKQVLLIDKLVEIVSRRQIIGDSHQINNELKEQIEAITVLNNLLGNIKIPDIISFLEIININTNDLKKGDLKIIGNLFWQLFHNGLFDINQELTKNDIGVLIRKSFSLKNGSEQQIARKYNSKCDSEIKKELSVFLGLKLKD